MSKEEREDAGRIPDDVLEQFSGGGKSLAGYARKVRRLSLAWEIF